MAIIKTLQLIDDLPVQKLDEVIFVVSAKDFEPFEVTHVSLLVLAEGHVADHGRLLESENKKLNKEKQC